MNLNGNLFIKPTNGARASKNWTGFIHQARPATVVITK